MDTAERGLEPASGHTSLAAIERLISQNVNPAVLEKFMDLHARWEAEVAVKAWNSAMAEVQKEMPVVVRDATNEHTKSKYARFETILEDARPVYTRHGFSLIFGTDKSGIDGHLGVTVDIAHALGHTVTKRGDFPLDDVGTKGNTNKTGIQATGSTYSYARRYLTCLVFNIALANQDKDGNRDGGFINEQQIEQINTLIEQCSYYQNRDNVMRLFRWLNVENLGQLKTADLAKAINHLNGALAKQQAAKKGGAA